MASLGWRAALGSGLRSGIGGEGARRAHYGCFYGCFWWFRRRGALERTAFAACGTVLYTTKRWE